MTSTKDARFWDRLLAVVEEGRAIPVVGEDLLTVTIDGQPVLLYRYLAERLAEYLELSTADLSDAGALHEVACRHLARGGNLDDIYRDLKTVFPARERLTVPTPLRQLAEIRDFKLFVTTTFDPLLEQAVNEVRFGGRHRARVFAFQAKAPQDLEKPLDQLADPVVFHLFGRLSTFPEYAVTEADMLEMVHSLQAESHRPNLLLDELGRSQLLLLGSRFPDWLARFFLRVTNRESLWVVRGKGAIVADVRMRSEPSLVAFLKHFSAQTQFFPGSATELVAGLHERWLERHPSDAAETAPGSPPLDMEPGAVFLSYASEDWEIVEKLKADLDREDVPAWFDRDRLESGDFFEWKIRESIKRCSLFVPILSDHTLTPEHRFFRTEWDWAEKEAVQALPNQAFIVPVVVGALSPRDPRIPERFRGLHWHRLPDDRSTTDLVDLLKRRLKDYQRLLAEAR